MEKPKTSKSAVLSLNFELLEQPILITSRGIRGNMNRKTLKSAVLSLFFEPSEKPIFITSRGEIDFLSMRH